MNPINNIKAKNVELVSKLINKIDLSHPTEEDYKNVQRQKTKLELILISLVVFGIEICYAAETAFVSPILQKIGVPIQYTSMVWGLSPIIGFLACPLLGSLSDDCDSRLGRRRPFIIIYSIGILTGLLLTGYGHVIGNFLLNTSGINPYVILFTILGVILLDFDCDACQSPARAYLIDVSHANDHGLGLSTFTVMAGAGGCIGYILGGIPWAELGLLENDESKNNSFNVNTNNQTNTSFDYDNYYQADLAYDHKQILFSFVAVIYVICALISITSFKEIPLNKLNKIKKTNSQCCNVKYDRMEESLDEDDYFSNQNVPNVENTNKNRQKYNSRYEQLKYYIRSIINMPNSLRWLCITHGFCWMSLLCYSLYFTDFVGEEVYGGIPSDETSNRFLNMQYDKGVRIGSFCMALYSISCSFYSNFLQTLMARFRTKNVYMFSQIIYSIGMLILALTKSKLMAALTSITAGVMYSCLFTIPFILVAKYHSEENFELIPNKSYNSENEELRNDDESNLKRGLGTDISLVSSMVFVAQFVLSFFIGSLIKIIGTKSVVIFAASFFSFCAALTSNKILYFD